MWNNYKFIRCVLRWAFKVSVLDLVSVLMEAGSRFLGLDKQLLISSYICSKLRDSKTIRLPSLVKMYC